MSRSRRNAKKQSRKGYRSTVPVYRGKFGVAEAERLLWRAGFGPRPGEAERVAKLGMRRAVKLMMKPPGGNKLVGPAPVIGENEPLLPADRWGHDHIWWLDRMVRSNHPLQERMTLIWHDWFATSNEGVGDQKLMLKQNQLLRHQGLGSFRTLLLSVTRDPAMLIWLSGNQNTKWAPNENYGRELMELFTLGANARYTENDVREQARALTGWTNDWGDQGYKDFRFKKELHDTGTKRIFRQRGKFDWKDACELCLDHPDHAGFFVKKIWGYFVPVPLKGKNLKALKSLYVASGYRIAPVVQAILMHPAFYGSPRMVKPPIVQSAGLMRARSAGITDSDWVWVSDMCGQRLFHPPNVSGWNDEMWLDTGTFRGRWVAAHLVTVNDALNPSTKAVTDAWDKEEPAATAVTNAIAYWNNPSLSKATVDVLTAFAQRSQDLADRDWKKSQFRVMRQNALRTMIAVSPDLQTA
jgi:uncharacterized protein (DUF1800 family)